MSIASKINQKMSFSTQPFPNTLLSSLISTNKYLWSHSFNPFENSNINNSKLIDSYDFQ